MKIEVGKKYVLFNRPDVEHVQVVDFDICSLLYSVKVYYTNGMVTWAGPLYNEEGNLRGTYSQVDVDNARIVAEWIDQSSLREDLEKITCKHDKIVNLSFMHIKMGCASCGMLEEDIRAEHTRRLVQSWEY
jgi:hypothetical protein